MILLSSCSHMSRQDGPPNFYVDETKIPNAVPKVEARAKYGNMPSYVVFGRRYYTMSSSKHYEAIGTASWYGTKFHSHRTSSGERYNMLAMTAAHKTLPLPTYVEVTNLKNNRKIIVKVNDRGPFESNRLIDLSYVAAKKLGMLGHGTARVKVAAIDPLVYARNHAKPSWHFPQFHTSSTTYASSEPVNKKIKQQDEPLSNFWLSSHGIVADREREQVNVDRVIAPPPVIRHKRPTHHVAALTRKRKHSHVIALARKGKHPHVAALTKKGKHRSSHQLFAKTKRRKSNKIAT